MQALQIFAGPKARASISRNGLQPGDICTIPAAAGAATDTFTLRVQGETNP